MPTRFRTDRRTATTEPTEARKAMPPCRRALASSSWRVRACRSSHSGRPGVVPPVEALRPASAMPRNMEFLGSLSTPSFRVAEVQKLLLDLRGLAEDALLLDPLGEEDVPGAGRHDRQDRSEWSAKPGCAWRRCAEAVGVFVDVVAAAAAGGVDRPARRAAGAAAPEPARRGAAAAGGQRCRSSRGCWA